MKNINIANDFSKYPAGRFLKDGPNSGERFRKDFLIPSLNENDKINIELDDTRGYGSSFLEEAFGGLVRLGFKKEDLKKKINFITKDKSLIEEIISYINEA